MSVKLDLGFMTFDLREIPAYARRAEELGVGALWSAETKHDPFLPLAVAGANTSRVQLGTAIAVAFSRSPMILAHTAWDLQKASGGRFVLGLGTQVKAHNERRFSVKWEPPGPRLREVVLALRAIWDPAVEAGLAKSGRSRKDFTFRASTMVVVGNDAGELERSRQAVKQQIAFYASTRTRPCWPSTGSTTSCRDSTPRASRVTGRAWRI